MNDEDLDRLDRQPRSKPNSSRTERIMPITQIQFRNFKVLREATLNLGRLTLLVGPNGSGKSTALEAFRFTSQVFGRSNQPVHQNDAVRLKSVGATGAPFLAVKVEGEDAASGTYELAWATDRTFGVNVNEAVRALFSRMTSTGSWPL